MASRNRERALKAAPGAESAASARTLSPVRRAAPGAALAVAFALLSWALYGYSFGRASNHSFYLPAVLEAVGSASFPGDLFVDAARRAPTFFWELVAGVAGVFGLERSAFWLWFGARGAAGLATVVAVRALGGGLGAGAQALVWTLFSSELFVSSPLAGDPMFPAHLDQTAFAWPLALAAAAAFLRGRKAAALLGLGVLANLNVLVASVTALWLVGAFALEKPRLKELVRLAAAFGLGAAPLAVRLAVSPPAPAVDVLLFATPNTYLPSVWPWERWVRAAAVFAFAAAAVRANGSPEARRLLRAGGLVLAAGFAAAFLRLETLLTLQLLRLDVALVWLGLVSLAPSAAACLGSEKPAEALPAAALAWSASTLFGSPLTTLWAAGLVGTLGRRLSFELGLGGLGLAAASVLADEGFFLQAPSYALATGLAGAAAAFGGSRPRRPLAAPARRAAAFLPAAALALFAFSVARARTERSPAAPFGEAAAWARRSPPGTFFVVAPQLDGFRLAARRPVFLEWTDFNSALWDARAGRAWLSRLARLGVDLQGFQEARVRHLRAWDRSVLRRGEEPLPSPIPPWSARDVPALEQAAADAGADHIVALSASELDLPVAFRAGALTIHEPSRRR